MKEKKSQLRLRELLFDKIRFERTGNIKNKNELERDFAAQVGENRAEGLYRVVLSTRFKKEGEYEGEIVIHGVFSFETEDEPDERTKDRIIRRNTVAIMMPYVRSELTMLTSQPGVDPVVLPAFNINQMFEENES